MEETLVLALREKRSQPKDEPSKLEGWKGCLIILPIIVLCVSGVGMGSVMIVVNLILLLQESFGDIVGVIGGITGIILLIMEFFFLLRTIRKLEKFQLKKRAKKYDKEYPRNDTDEIWLTENSFVLKQDEEKEIIFNDIRKMILTYSIDYEQMDGLLPSTGWGIFTVEYKNEKEEKYPFQLTNEKNIPLFITILKSWYAHQPFTLKERSYDGQRVAQLLLQKEWEYKELNHMKEKLGIDTIY